MRKYFKVEDEIRVLDLFNACWYSGDDTYKPEEVCYLLNRAYDNGFNDGSAINPIKTMVVSSRSVATEILPNGTLSCRQYIVEKGDRG